MRSQGCNLKTGFTVLTSRLGSSHHRRGVLRREAELTTYKIQLLMNAGQHDAAAGSDSDMCQVKVHVPRWHIYGRETPIYHNDTYVTLARRIFAS